MTTPPRDLVELTHALLGVARTALDKHPVLAAMATQLQALPGPLVRFTFDGPALPEKQFFEVSLESGAAHQYQMMIEAALPTCERAIAAAMRKAGYAGGAG